MYHGDVICGFIITNNELLNDIRYVGLKDMTGAVLSPFDSYLVQRGLKTLGLRMKDIAKMRKSCGISRKTSTSQNCILSWFNISPAI